MTTTSQQPSKGGRGRVQELAAQREAAIQTWKSAMLAGLGRAWTAAEEITATTIASLFIMAAHKRSLGQDDLPLLREAAELMRDSVFRDPHSVPSRTVSAPSVTGV